MILQIHKYGFKAPNDNMTVKDLLNRKIDKAKFSDIKTHIPAGFDVAERSKNRSQMQVAVEV